MDCIPCWILTFRGAMSYEPLGAFAGCGLSLPAAQSAHGNRTQAMPMTLEERTYG